MREDMGLKILGLNSDTRKFVAAVSSAFIVLIVLQSVARYSSCLGCVAHKQAHVDNNNVPDTPLPQDEICMSDTCVESAARLKENMDASADPCEDFYQFACGSFVKNTVIPDDESGVNTYMTVGNNLTRQLRTLLDEEQQQEEIAPFAELRKFYRSCMDETRVEELGLTPLTDVLAQLGGWPAVVGEEWNEAEFSWAEAIYKLRQLGFDHDILFDMSVSQDIQDSTKRLLDFDQPRLGMVRRHPGRGTRDPDISAYLKYQTELAVLLGADRDTARKEMKEALLFEMAMYDYSLSDDERRNLSQLYNKMTIEEMQAKWPDIPWLEYVNRLLAPFNEVDIQEPVNVIVPSYFDKFNKLLLETPKRTIANYILWRVAFASASYLTEDVRKLDLAFNARLTGQRRQTPRWKMCIEEVLKDRGESSIPASNSYALAMSSMYVRRFFDEKARLGAQEMVEDIRAEFDMILDELDWIDETTKGRAKDKLKTMTSHVGYPVELLDDQKLTELYSDMKMDDGAYFRNVLTLTAFAADYCFRSLREPVNKTSWTRHGYAAMANAYNDLAGNSIEVPAGILQGGFFGADRPKYMNYGAIGYVIGHEITHGFDDQGRRFDAIGNMVDWWDPQTLEQFKGKAQCMIEQYENYSLPEADGLKVDGINTQGENIADNGGLKESYRAYRRYVEKNAAEPGLPGLQNFTPQQLFWLSAANVYCAVSRPEAARNGLLSDPHAPERFRVIGPFSNLVQFSEDFNCKPNAGMNPENKCSVW